MGLRTWAAGALAGMLVLAVPVPAEASVAADKAVDLRTEAQTRPLGIDVARPRLEWRMDSDRRGAAQSAYRVVVARSETAARSGIGALWDSGTVRTSRPWATYAGPRLAPHQRYWWSVRILDERGRAAAGVPTSWFETAFTSARQWRADWISGPALDQDCTDLRRCSPAPLLRREFLVRPGLTSARLHASGLGYGTFHLNGRRVGKDVLAPGFTEYDERALYVTHDVTGLLRAGRNAIGAELGRGPFGSQGDNYAGYQSAPWHAEPRLRLELHLRYRDGSTQVVPTSRKWRTTSGPRLFDDYMLGETYDGKAARRFAGWSRVGFDDRRWQRAPRVDGPAGRLEAQVEEPIRPQRRLRFDSVSETAAGTWLFDLGEDVTGNAVLDLDVPTGDTITLKYGERLDENGSVTTAGFSYDTSSEAGGGPMQLDTYVGGPGRDRWRPEFTFKGFRYVEVAGLEQRPPASALTAEVWRTDFDRTGRWTGSDGLLRKIFDASVRAIESNTLSIPMDTPIYEKTGYTADGHLVAGAASYLFDTRRFYRKWLTDIRQSVAPNGDMGISAPLPGQPADPQPTTGFTHTSPGWDAALFVVPEVLELFGGDERPGRAALPEMERVRDYYETRIRNDILAGRCTVVVMQACDDGLGDWTSPAGTSSGAAVDSTGWYVYMLRRLAATAAAAGDEDAARAASTRAEEVGEAFVSTFYNPVLGQFLDPFNPLPAEPTRPGAPSGYSQHQNAMALGLDLVPEEERQRVGDGLAADVAARGDHLNTGIMGTRFLFEALASTGHVDAALAVLQQRTYPSYGFWLDELGYTSLGEYWEEGQRSHNHQMYASVVQWLYEGLAGIRPTADGFARVLIAPQVPSSGLDEVRASTRTVRGTVASSWKRTPDGLVLTVVVPANVTSEVRVPVPEGATVLEAGTGRAVPAGRAPGVRELARDAELATYAVGAGRYRFLVKG